ncbi:MAG TPA: PepSY domain-containing protein [Planctomycetota bacterium]|nr:PepSY domain-containing protein [Planctomycetota bacterium]
MNNPLALLAPILVLAASGCGGLIRGEGPSGSFAIREAPAMALEDEADDDGDDQEIALADVPANVKEAAIGAVPGLVLTEAEIEVEDGVTVYSLEGTADGKEYEVEVASDGRVLEVEAEDDEDDDGEDD